MAINEPNDTPLRVATRIRFVVFALLVMVALAGFAALLLIWEQGVTVAYLEEIILSWGMWGVFASIGLMIAHSFIPFPAEFLALANGMIFGPFWGTVVTWTGAMLGASLAFALARALGRPFVAGLVARKNWHHIDEWSSAQGAYVILTMRLIPVIAFNLINYAAGLTRMSWWMFLWTTAVGILPLTVLMVLMGSALDVIAWPVWILLVIGLAATWFGVLQLQKRALRAAARSCDAEESRS